MKNQIQTTKLSTPKATLLLLSIGILSLVGCVSISNTTDLGVWSNEDKTFVSVEIPTNEMSFNWHVGGWMNGLDRYKLTIPRKSDVVEGDRIVLNRGIGATDRLAPVSQNSRVEIVGRGSCSIEIRILPSG